MASRVGRIGALSTGAMARVSIPVGLGTEVAAFEITNRLLGTEDPPNPNVWKWEGEGGIRQGLLNSLITFGSLKVAGQLATGENIVVQHLFQDSAMVFGHQMAAAFGVGNRPTASLPEQFLHAEATNLQLTAGMAMVHGMTPGMTGLERGLDLS